MKPPHFRRPWVAALLLSAGLLQSATRLPAGTTIDSANHHAYGANVGWLDWMGDGASGAVMGEYVCSGFIYSANVGWINLGNGSPTNGIYYQNISAGDFGVNQDGLGNLRGFAYGANIGWIHFETNGAPRVDLLTGNLSGYAWSANCGWISLSNAVAHVRAAAFSAGALDTNGLPVAWELAVFGNTGIDPAADPDHDGVSNYQEYLAGTDPQDAADYLKITNLARSTTNPGRTSLAWAGKPNRLYVVQQTGGLGADATWMDWLILPGAGGGSADFADTNNQSFYRLRAHPPSLP